MARSPTFGEALRAARKAEGLSQRALAELLWGAAKREDGQKTISKWERDRHEPLEENTAQLERVLNTSLQQYRTRERPTEGYRSLLDRIEALEQEQKETRQLVGETQQLLAGLSRLLRGESQGGEHVGP